MKKTKQLQVTNQAQIEPIIEKLISERHLVTVAIDGRCGSGKTMLAAGLMKRFYGTVFHLDDFYLLRHQRAAKKKEAGFANADLERFENEVLKNLGKDKAFSYFKYFPKLGVTEEVKVEIPTQVNIVEGSYCTDESLRRYYDLTIFVTAPLEQRLERLADRGENVDDYIKKWIPYEENFFAKQETEGLADIILDEAEQPK